MAKAREHAGPYRGLATVAITLRSGRSSNNRPTFSHDPVMRCATAGCVLLYADEPMQSLSGGKLDAVGFTLSVINRFRRLLPA